jgi:YD repeat-containing protein
MITQTAIVSGDYTYDASNRLTKYKASANKTVQNITYNASGYIATYQEVVTIGGSAVTTSYTVTTNASGNITAISAA